MQIVGIELAGNKREEIVVFPVGTFKTGKYPKVDLSRKVAEQIVANFTNRVLRRDVRVDLEHEFAEACAWIRGLRIGTYTDPETGSDREGLIAAVEWTAKGATLLDSGEYRYLSAAIGRYRDPDSGKWVDNVLMAVSLTNDPCLPVPPIGEVEIALHGQPELTFAFADLDITPDVSEDDPETPEDEAASISASVIIEGDYTISPEKAREVALQMASTPAETVDDLLARYDALMSEMDDMASGSSGVKAMRTLARETRAKLAAILSRKGGTEMSEPTPEVIELTERNASLEAELAEVRATQRNERVASILDAATAKGAGEPLKLALSNVMDLCDEAVDAVAEVVDVLEVVPVEPVGEQPAPEPEEVELSDEVKHIASLMNVDPEVLKTI